MVASIPDWDLFQSLHAVLQAGSLSAAARARGLTQPTLGRHIEALEQKLGGALFLRSPRGLQPTELAIELQSHLEEMAAAASAALRDAGGATGEVGGCIRLTASEIMGGHVLPPMLTRFREAHPSIDLELVVSNRNEDLLRRDADIAVRMSRPTQNALVARKAGVAELGLYAAPSYVARHGLPRTRRELDDHPVIGFDAPRPKVMERMEMPRPVDRDAFAFRSDSDQAQLAMLREGFGVGACMHQLARAWGLVPVLEGEFRLPLESWICMHESLKTSRRMRLMFDHLVEELSRYLAPAPESVRRAEPAAG